MAGSYPTAVADGNAGVYNTCFWQRLTERPKSDCDAGGFSCVLHYRHRGGQSEMARI